MTTQIFLLGVHLQLDVLPDTIQKKLSDQP